MNWFFRFILNLPPRTEDLTELQNNFPELLDSSSSLEHFYSRFHLHFHSRSNAHLFGDFDLSNLKKWIHHAKEKGNEQISRVPVTNQECSYKHCPNKKLDPSDNESNNSVEIEIQKLMVMGGEKDKKKPLDSFLKLVKKVHSQAKSAPNAIYITDPYLYSNTSAKGTTEGFQNLISYLKVLGLDSSSSFNLYCTNKPKMGDVANLKKELINSFPKCSVVQFKTNNTFHDRLYLCVHPNHGCLGTFGPSLNGLTDDDIVLMGELESNAIDFLKRVLSI